MLDLFLKKCRINSYFVLSLLMEKFEKEKKAVTIGFVHCSIVNGIQDKVCDGIQACLSDDTIVKLKVDSPADYNQKITFDERDQGLYWPQEHTRKLLRKMLKDADIDIIYVSEPVFEDNFEIIDVSSTPVIDIGYLHNMQEMLAKKLSDFFGDSFSKQEFERQYDVWRQY